MDFYKTAYFLQAIKEGHNTSLKIIYRTGIYSVDYNIKQLKRLELIDVEWDKNKRVFTLTQRGNQLLKAINPQPQNT